MGMTQPEEIMSTLEMSLWDCRPRLKPNTILFKTGNRAVRIGFHNRNDYGASEGIPGGLQAE